MVAIYSKSIGPVSAEFENDSVQLQEVDISATTIYFKFIISRDQDITKYYYAYRIISASSSGRNHGKLFFMNIFGSISLFQRSRSVRESLSNSNQPHDQLFIFFEAASQSNSFSSIFQFLFFGVHFSNFFDEHFQLSVS